MGDGMGYAVKKSGAESFFVGFGAAPEYTPVWGTAQEARVWDEMREAKLQALCFMANDINVQQKPVAV